MCHSFPFIFRLPGTWLFMCNSVGVSRKADDAYPTSAHGLYSQFLVVSELLTFVALYVLFCLFYVFVVIVCFPCLVSVPGLHLFCVLRWNLGSLDYSLQSQNIFYVFVVFFSWGLSFIEIGIRNWHCKLRHSTNNVTLL